jgi:hypothetical protein
MPLVRIDISKTASRERVHDVGNAVYNAMIAVANVPRKRPNPARLSDIFVLVPFRVLSLHGGSPMAHRRSWAKANNPFWSAHLAAWYRSALDAEDYCRRRVLLTATLML